MNETAPPSKKMQPNSKSKVNQRNQIEEKKLDVLNKCTSLLTQGNEPKKNEVSPFALYIDQKLKEIDPKTRLCYVLVDFLEDIQKTSITHPHHFPISTSILHS